MEFKHSSDFDDCHYLQISKKCYKLGFIINEAGVFPDMLEEIDSNDLPLELQVEWGFITLKAKLQIEKKQEEELREKIEISKSKIEKDNEYRKFLELKEKFEK